MPDISILKEMLKNSSLVEIEDHDHYPDKKNVKLKEKNLYSVSVNGLPDDSRVVVFKVDDFPSPKSIFEGTKGECKRADFVIVANTAVKKVIVIIEMKARKGSTTMGHIIKQLKGAQCVVKYSQEIGKTFWNSVSFLEEFEYRFVCFTDISIPKRSTSVKKNISSHDTPENVLKINAPNPKGIQFGKLI